MRTALAFLVIGLALPMVLAIKPVATGENPHGTPNGCVQCHDVTAPGTAPDQMVWTSGTPDGACNACHAYPHHQSDLMPDRVGIPADWPVSQGRLACFTCHDEPSHPRGSAPIQGKWYLRSAPYARVGEFCARCHAAEGAAQPFNPHSAVDATRDRAVCLHCHTEAPDPSRAVGELRVLSMNICVGCHKVDVHAGSKEHFGRAPIFMHWEGERAGLPMTEDGTMGCITCHDPHQGGVLPNTAMRDHWVGKPLYPDRWAREVVEPTLAERRAALGVESLVPPPVEPDFLWLPARNGRLCSVCHVPSQIDSDRRKSP